MPQAESRWHRERAGERSRLHWQRSGLHCHRHAQEQVAQGQRGEDVGYICTGVGCIATGKERGVGHIAAGMRKSRRRKDREGEE